VTDKRLKIQIIHLLVGIAMIDGGLVKNELWLLRELIRQLNLEQSDLDSILSIYFEEEQKSTLANSKLTTRENALNILELEQNVTLKEIKKAYRKLVMIHHPDKFINEGEEELKLAEARFLKIQEAYEFLVKG
jgi:DnaJ like chaperone protein